MAEITEKNVSKKLTNEQKDFITGIVLAIISIVCIVLIIVLPNYRDEEKLEGEVTGVEMRDGVRWVNYKFKTPKGEEKSGGSSDNGNKLPSNGTITIYYRSSLNEFSTDHLSLIIPWVFLATIGVSFFLALLTGSIGLIKSNYKKIIN